MKTSTLFLVGGWGFAATATSQAAIEPGKLAFFEKEIRPLLVEHCYECHSAAKEKDKGGLTLDTEAGWMDGGDSGPALVPGKISESLLIEAVEQGDPDFAMPPKYKLQPSEIAALKKWVAMGAPDPRDGKPKAAPKSEIDIAEGRKHWSFQAVAKKAPPAVKNGDWAADPLDRFVLAAQEAKGLKPVADADRRTLIRRASFDLIGLPPTPEEIHAFVKDPGTDEEAFAKVVDRLLASPHFGERWGRHWLDVVRYGESMGRTRNYPFPFAWRYRDYVIAAFNKDKPFDQFVVEQLAGDLLPNSGGPAGDELKIATGFLALGSMDLNERDQAKFKMDVIDDQIDVTGRAFMALTTGCARCHDHKFDPIPTSDYYALAGIFGSTQTLSGYASRQGGGNRNMNPKALVSLSKPDGKPAPEPPKPSKKELDLREQLAKLRAEEKTLKTRIDNTRRAIAKDGGDAKTKDGKPLKLSLSQMQKRAGALKGQVGKLNRQIDNLAKARKSNTPVSGNLAMGAADSAKVEDCKICVRGDVDNRGAAVPRGFLQVLMPAGEKAKLPSDSSGRLELARWMASPSHPLTARVMANRVWHHLFGKGIVPTVDNFGNSGLPPSNQALLDHLAARFSGDMGWSVKKLIRATMLSRSYRLASSHHEANHATDPDNIHLWRANVRRLEAEALRDSMMLVAGTLKLEPAKGSPVGKMKGGEIGRQVQFAAPDDFAHRSVYLPIVRNFVPEFLEVFDFAEPASVIGRRDVTTVSTQALYLLNDKFVISQSATAAKRVLTDKRLDNPDKRVAGAYFLVLGRPPSGGELSAARQYLEAAQGDGQKPEEAWGGLLQALFAGAEFRYVL